MNSQSHLSFVKYKRIKYNAIVQDQNLLWNTRAPNIFFIEYEKDGKYNVSSQLVMHPMLWYSYLLFGGVFKVKNPAIIYVRMSHSIAKAIQLIRYIWY